LVFHPHSSGAAFALAESLRPEHVLTALGTVVARDQANVNPNLPTGDIEVQVAEAERLATSETPPFAVDEDSVDVDEVTRLKYRYIDLRRARMRDTLLLRSLITQTMREVLAARDFVEVE